MYQYDEPNEEAWGYTLLPKLGAIAVQLAKSSSNSSNYHNSSNHDAVELFQSKLNCLDQVFQQVRIYFLSLSTN